MKTRYLFLIVLLTLSWILMTCSHEVGHLIGGWCGGATLIDFDLAPWRLPYSLHGPDPNPQLTLWAGPVFGVLVPMLVAFAMNRRAIWFLADFCLIANGAYLALAWVAGDRYLDTPRMLAAGIHPVSIVVYCFATIGVGYVRFRGDCIAILADEEAGDQRDSEGHIQTHDV